MARIVDRSYSFRVEITGWEKHNPRTDVKFSYWFKLRNAFFEDDKVLQMTHLGQLLYLYLLCLCSKTGSGMPMFCPFIAQNFLKCSKKAINTALEQLIQLRVIHVPRESNVVPDKKREEEKREEEKRGEEIRREEISKTTHTSEEMEECKGTWIKTLKHFGMTREILATEEIQIARAIQRFGNARSVSMALVGPRAQPKDDRFNPADFLSLDRILRNDKFNMYLNLGTKWVNEKEKRNS